MINTRPQEIEVYEHDRLTTNRDGFNQKHLELLIKLNEFHGFSYFDIIRDGVKFKQYVGIIQIGNLIIKINPKSDKSERNEKWQGLTW